jgi:kumamolisin
MRHLKYRSIYPVLLVPVLSSLLVIAVLLLHVFPFPFTHASSVSGRVTLPSSVAAYASKSRVLSRAAGGQSLSLAVGLKLRNETDLDSYLQQITSPQSPLYRHYLNVATFKALYAPLPSSEAAVRSFLQSQGFTVTGTYANHLVVDVRGTVAQAEQTFQVQINNYQGSDGKNFYANASAPSLPGDVGSLVASVSGLDNLIQYSRVPLGSGVGAQYVAPNSNTVKTSFNSHASITCPQPGPATVPTSYTPVQIAMAYNFTKLYQGALGEGQTVGLLELDGFSPNDIALYASCFGGKNTTIKTIPIDGFNGTPGVNAVEVELDMEMLLGLAPRLAELRVYEASITSLSAYNDAWARIVNDAVPVVSTSWVFCEQGPGMTGEIQQENIFFKAAAAQGQTILAASGDLGATGCYNPQTGANTFPAVDDPASQPYVTGVGGTTLRINPDNTYLSEQVWNDRTSKNGASGGGVSQVWPMPSWQQGPGVANAYSTGFREVPDVAINADPQTGYDVYCTVGGCAGKGWQVLGGTSAAAPVWAAMVALANETALKANGFQMGFLNPSLYSISHGAAGTSYAAAFHDIVPVQGAVNNNDYVGSSGTYPTTSMYDLATGLGSFDAFNLAQNLITLGETSATMRVATSTTWYFAEGRVGGGFQEFLTLENPDTIQTAHVQVQYLFEDGTGPAFVHNVPPQSRATISANGDLNIVASAAQGRSISMIVTSLNGIGIVAERPMYFSWHGINSGTDAMGATQLGTDFYFADVESQRNYSSFITILNPPGGSSANVTVEYIAGGTILGKTTIVVPAGRRGTTIPQALGITRQCAVHVQSDQPVMVERPMYFTTSRSNINGPVTGAATVVGTQAPGTDWLFAEGYTGPNFHEYLVLANFDTATTANVTVNLEYSNGAVNPITATVAPESQTFFDINAASAGFSQSTPEVSAEVTSDAPIVAQRQEYFRFSGTLPGGTDVIGLPGPAKVTYSFAEGYTTKGFSEFLTLQNPNTTSESVAVTLYLANSITTQQIVTVGAQTRVTISINSLVQPIAQANPDAGYEVSMSVQALSGTIVAERPMYFNYHNISTGGSDVVGYTG